MKLKVLFILCLCIGLSNCKIEPKRQYVTKIIEVNIDSNDKCYFFRNEVSDTMKFNRNLKIIENTISDSIIIGNSVLAPNYIGDLEYTMLENNKEVVLDLRYENPAADRIWVFPFKMKKSKGTLKLQLTYTNADN